ncbi:MAG: hypothetical protein JW727_00740 [Candidatus Aenigmarchaeota archaeon]|nr:hypothetical protein [Candidatus Aenigmarchaeota archaeon]
MRQEIFGIFAALLMLSMVLGAGTNSQGSGPSENPEELMVENQQKNLGEDDQLREEISTENNAGDEKGNGMVIAPNGQGDQKGAENAREVRSQLEEKQREMEREMENLTEQQKNVLKNQNQVKLAVHALLGMENQYGGIGQNISQIAREFNNSVNKTIQAEEKIQTRSNFSRFLFGGDENAAQMLEQETTQNQERVQELNRLIADCECDEEIKLLLREQVQNLEQEQIRLNQLAQEEKQSKGLLGWLWK